MTLPELPQLEQIPEQPAKWYAGIPMTVAVPGRRDDLALEFGTRPKSVVFKAKELAGAVEAIWTDLRHGAITYWGEENDELYQRWNAVHGYLRKIASVRVQVREFIAEVPWKLFVDWPWPLWKCYGPRVTTTEERAGYNYMAHFSEDLGHRVQLV